MSSILGTMDAYPESTIIQKSRKRKPYDDSSSPARPPMASYRAKPKDHADMSSDGPMDDSFGPPPSDDFIMSPNKKVKTNGMTPAVDRLAHLDVHGSSDGFDTSFDDLDMNEFMDVDVDDIDMGEPSKPPTKAEIDITHKPADGIPAKAEAALPSWLSVYDSLSVADADAFGPLASTSTISVNPTKISALEGDGSLNFFWLDYLEHDGKIYLIGKLKDKTSGAWVSCCVTVENLQRNLFVLPREKRVEQDEDGELYETDGVPSLQDVYDDFDRIRKKIGIKSWKAKFVKRKYAFGETDVPRGESQWMKVVYGFNGEQASSTTQLHR